MRKKRRGVSAGTLLMLALLLIVLSSFTYVFLKLRTGSTTDLTALSQTILSLGEPHSNGETAETTNPVAAPSRAPQEDSSAAAPGPAEISQPKAREEQLVRLTVGGTAAIEKNVRQSAYAADTQVYDFTEIMTLLRPKIKGDIKAVFIENVLSDQGKVNSVVVPACAAQMTASAGFDTALAGFSKAWTRAGEGIESTCDALEQNDLTPLGILPSEGKSQYVIREIRGIRVAMMEFTGTVTLADRNKMKRKNAEWMIPDTNPESIAAQIAAARNAGAEIVVVFLHWGKAGTKSPDKSQIALAQQIADAGADAIIGAGSRIAQPVEFLQTADSRQVLCAWSLGTLISDDRKPASRIGGFLLHLTYGKNTEGKAELRECSYTPVYTWSYRQDNKTYYKCLPADQSAPDGMDSEQITTKEKTLEAVQTALKDFPAPRKQEANGNQSP